MSDGIDNIITSPVPGILLLFSISIINNIVVKVNIVINNYYKGQIVPDGAEYDIKWLPVFPELTVTIYFRYRGGCGKSGYVIQHSFSFLYLILFITSFSFSRLSPTFILLFFLSFF